MSEAEARLPLKSILESHLKLFHVHPSVKNTPFVLDKHTAEIELKHSDSYLNSRTLKKMAKLPFSPSAIYTFSTQEATSAQRWTDVSIQNDNKLGTPDGPFP